MQRWRLDQTKQRLAEIQQINHAKKMLIKSIIQFLANPFPKQEEPVEPIMTPNQDAFNIWSKAGSAGMNKYLTGSEEHKTQFWTAGAGWYAKNLHDEQLDLISYLHHLTERIKLCQLLSKMMEDEEVSLRDAAILLNNLVSDAPPQKLPKISND
jgi:hypothetical protein